MRRDSLDDQLAVGRLLGTLDWPPKVDTEVIGRSGGKFSSAAHATRGKTISLQPMGNWLPFSVSGDCVTLNGPVTPKVKFEKVTSICLT